MKSKAINKKHALSVEMACSREERRCGCPLRKKCFFFMFILYARAKVPALQDVPQRVCLSAIFCFEDESGSREIYINKTMGFLE